MAVAPCGTPAAYRRHLRHGENPCPACRRANRDLKRAQADQRRRREKVSGPAPDGPVLAAAPVPVPTPAPASAPTGPPSDAADLLAARDALVYAINRVDDPARLPGLVRELRETWKALRDLDAAPPLSPGEDEFAAARRRRAAAGRS